MTLFFLFGLSGCMTVDAFLPFHKQLHCSEVTEATCNNEEDEWDTYCITCDEDYDWGFEYPWREKTMAPYEDMTVSDLLGTDTMVIDDLNLVTPAAFETEDGQANLDAYFFYSHGRNPSVSDTTIVYNHGNHRNIEHYIPRVIMLHALGYNVYTWDYRGYGKSMASNGETPPPTATPQEWMEDSRQAFAEVKTFAPDPNKIIVYGMSVGGIPGGEQMDTGEGICAQIFEAAWVSLKEQVETNLSFYFPGSFLTSGLFENDIKLSDTTTPTLIFQGDLDDAFRKETAQALYDAIPESTPKELIFYPDAYHGMTAKDRPESGGVPDSNFVRYATDMSDFLLENASDCFTISATDSN